MPRATFVTALAVAALVAPGAASAGVRADSVLVRAGLVRALQNGWLKQGEAEGHWLTVRRYRAARTLLPRDRRRELDGVFHDVALHAGGLVRPRAHALFAMLETNTSYFATNAVPPARTEVIGADGALYRAFPGHGLQFHPLGNVGRLNGTISAKDAAGATRLVAALQARLVDGSGGAVWEYYFQWGSGGPPWTSGMVQAVGAHALARASRLLERPRLLKVARRVYREAERHLIPLRAGPWTRLYSFSDLSVLNAHLQAIVSLRRYAAIAQDTAAAQLAEVERRAAVRLLPRFDTGSWSLYALRGAPASMHYHLYVVDLLRRLANDTNEPIWGRYAARFTRYALRRAAGVTLSPADADALATWPN